MTKVSDDKNKLQYAYKNIMDCYKALNDAGMDHYGQYWINYMEAPDVVTGPKKLIKLYEKYKKAEFYYENTLMEAEEDASYHREMD